MLTLFYFHASFFWKLANLILFNYEYSSFLKNFAIMNSSFNTSIKVSEKKHSSYQIWQYPFCVLLMNQNLTSSAILLISQMNSLKCFPCGFLSSLFLKSSQEFISKEQRKTCLFSLVVPEFILLTPNWLNLKFTEKIERHK